MGVQQFEGLIGAPPLTILLYLYQALTNIIIAICCIILNLEGLIKSDLFIFFIKTNLSWPVLIFFRLYLDGGRMRAILSIFIGYQKQQNGNIIGKILAIVMFFGIYIVFYTH